MVPDVSKGEFNDMLTSAKTINTMGNGDVQAKVIERGKQLKLLQKIVLRFYI